MGIYFFPFYIWEKRNVPMILFWFDRAKLQAFRVFMNSDL